MTINHVPPNWGDDPDVFIQFLAPDYGKLPVATWAYRPAAMFAGLPTTEHAYNIRTNAVALLTWADSGLPGPYAVEWLLFQEHVRVAVEEWLDAVFPEWDQ